MQTQFPTTDELSEDIRVLHERGYSAALRALPERGPIERKPYTLDELLAALRAAGYSDAQISERNYRC